VAIKLDPAIVSYTDTAGTGNPAAATVAITGDGQLALTGLKLGVTAYGSGGSGWLTAKLSDSTAPATLTLTARISGLNAGTYTANVPLTSSVATNSPQVEQVTLTLSPPPAPPPPPPGPTITIVATGNMGRCGSDLGREAAQVVKDANPDYVLVLGANAPASNGHVTTLDDYMNCYQPVWGQFLSKTYATLGDKEVDIDSIPPNFGSGMAAGADAYFGPGRVGPAGKNWYSFDVGAWHLIGLNVQSPGGYKRPEQIAYHAGTAQLNWLISDLKSHSKKCTLAFWYEAMWYSATETYPGRHYPNDGYRIQDVRGVWTALYENNADLVVNAWPHIYERFAPMRYAEGYQHPTSSEWAADSARGIRQITTGLGGDGPTVADSAVIRLPTSLYRSGGNGVLKLVLGDSSYTWEFLNTRYSHITDSGTGYCH
jgi:hypothetical protein